jgi:hypothetical protein
MKILSISFLFFAIALGAFINTATALEVTFPLAELGNCASKTECRVYCNKAANIEACAEFAEKQNLISNEHVKRARKLAEAISNGGPGGCTTAEGCKTFCEKAGNFKICAEFASKSGLVSNDEGVRLEKLKDLKVLSSELPGKCSTIQNCREYCSKTENKEECLNFAEKTQALPQREITKARQLLLKNVSPVSLPIDGESNSVRSRVSPVPSRKPAVTLPVKNVEVRVSPIISGQVRPSFPPAIPQELLRGGGTNTPPPKTSLREAFYRRAYLGSVLNFFFR